MDLGNFLIKQVAQRVLAEFPHVQKLITLSPIPGFRSWLHTQVHAELKRVGQADQQVGQLNALSLFKARRTAQWCRGFQPGSLTGTVSMALILSVGFLLDLLAGLLCFVKACALLLKRVSEH